MRSFFFRRVINSHTKYGLIVFLLILPSLELIWYVKQIVGGGYAYNPAYANFLQGNSVGIGHIFQGVYFWIMPLYCMILAGEDCLEDKKIGYINVLESRIGKKAYIKQNICKSFFLISGVILSGLCLNLILTNILLNGGSYSPELEADINSFSTFWMQNFQLNIWLHIFLAAIVCGELGVLCCLLAYNTANKKIAYFLIILFWFIEILKPNSITDLFQIFDAFSSQSKFVENILEFFIPCTVLIIFLKVKGIKSE